MSGIVALISGRGSNMQALLEAGLPVTAVISNRPDARGLETATARGIPAEVVDHKAFSSREAFDAMLLERVLFHRPSLVVLAGFMRVLGSGFVQALSGRLMNIHPSLLPAFPGLDTHQRALDAGVKLHGCTVHFVTEALDHGPIVAQAAVPVLDDDTAATLAARVLEQEHRLLPAAARWFLEQRLEVSGLRVSLRGAALPATPVRMPEVP
jgi:phosphoribosylglycinamide formyltransferase-1